MKKYRYIKDNKLTGRKKGEVVEYSRVSTNLAPYVEEVVETVSDADGRPDETWKKDDIIAWLGSHGVEGKGTKEELLDLVKKVK